MPNTKDQAIKAALNQEWETAVDLNHSLLTENPADIATLNRLGFAHMQLGQVKLAKTSYNKVIKIDRYNPIANKSLQKLSKIKSQNPPKPNSPKVFASFIEEPGKTKTVALVRIGEINFLLSLTAGTPVNLAAKKHRVLVESVQHKYIGCLPDDLGFKLGRLINLGYKYETVIKSVDNKSATIFIKEISRSLKGNNISSFSPSTSVLSIPRPQPPNRDPVDVTPTGEDDAPEVD